MGKAKGREPAWALLTRQTVFGLTHGLISQKQYSELVTVVILSAFVPTLVAQQFFQPIQVDEEEEEAPGAEDVGTVRRWWRGQRSVGDG